MDGIERNEEQMREANDLYWGSATSVNRIADRLGLSKGSLYAAIEPLDSGSICPMCAEPLVYTNRTALERGQLLCSGCNSAFSEKAEGGARGKPPSAGADRVPAPKRGAGAAPAAARHPVVQDPVFQDRAALSGRTSLALDAQEAVGRPSRQLVLSTTMLGLGLGLLLRRVLR